MGADIIICSSRTDRILFEGALERCVHSRADVERVEQHSPLNVLDELTRRLYCIVATAMAYGGGVVVVDINRTMFADDEKNEHAR